MIQNTLIGVAAALLFADVIVLFLRRMRNRRVNIVQPGIAIISIPALGTPPVGQPALNLGASEEAWLSNSKSSLYTEC